MKKIQKNKKGFTLIEMVLVIAIIVILASVMFFAVSNYLTKARTAAAAIKDHNDAVESISSDVAAEEAAAEAGTYS